MKQPLVCAAVLVLSGATGAHAQQSASIDPAEMCGAAAEGDECWQELQSHAACHVWKRRPYDPDRLLYGGETATWTGQCSGGLVEGGGTLTFTGPGGRWTEEGSWVAGKPHGMLNIRFESNAGEVPFLNGEIHGTEIYRYADGAVIETPWVNGERHGIEVAWHGDGGVTETPWVNGEVHGIQVGRYADGGVTEIPWVDGELHGMLVERYGDGSVREAPWGNGRLHGTAVSRFADGTVSELTWVNGEAHGARVERWPDGTVLEFRWVRGEEVCHVEREPNGRMTPCGQFPIAESPVADAPTLPPGPLCPDTAEHEACWMELDTLPDCFILNLDPQKAEIDTWSGQCPGGLGTGTAVYDYGPGGPDEGVFEVPYANGEPHGTAVLRYADGDMIETPWVNGRMHGMQVGRYVGGDVIETPYVNGEMHGTAVRRWSDGAVVEASWVNGEMHGTEFFRNADGDVVETPYVNGRMHGMQVERFADGTVLETRWVSGEEVCAVDREPNGRVTHDSCN